MIVVISHRGKAKGDAKAMRELNGEENYGATRALIRG